jgi:hypothetical protein
VAAVDPSSGRRCAGWLWVLQPFESACWLDLALPLEPSLGVARTAPVWLGWSARGKTDDVLLRALPPTAEESPMPAIESRPDDAGRIRAAGAVCRRARLVGAGGVARLAVAAPVAGATRSAIHAVPAFLGLQ